MKSAISAATLVALSTTGAFAAGVERSTQSALILFEPGNYVELSYGNVKPSVSGVQQVPAGATSPAGASSGDVLEDYSTLSFGFKMAVNEKVDLALVIDEPIGADTFYRPNTGYLYGGSTLAFGGSQASIDSNAATLLGRYKINENFSVFGGLRALRTGGQVSLFNGYKLDVPKETDYGYVVGVAYEKPEIALRVALTYNSAIKHAFTANESAVNPATGAPIALSTAMPVEIPQSVNLEFQSGVAKDTLVFGSIRYVDWTAFTIDPTIYRASTGMALVDYNSDTITWTLGVGRRFTPNWSGAIFASYEDPMGGFSGNLGPTDGQKSIGVAVTYERDQFEVTLGARYVALGDTTTQAPTSTTPGQGFPPGTTFSSFTDNHAVAVGLKVAFKF
ncbi:outer membrane protein transport protein [Oceaniglobus roseus]|uniref:outer membrane protein transport protein n=1 Tax=Oceaniglobus roseus TaxID=1737570 RepID=UPI001FEA6B1E|nr:hypothetical protein [Kandeliimicrobium roseum]